MIKIIESLEITYGGLPAGGNFDKIAESEYQIGMAKFSEACHCIMGSLNRASEYKTDGRQAVKLELHHIDEEIGLLEKIKRTYGNDIYIDKFNENCDRRDLKDILDNAFELKNIAERGKSAIKIQDYDETLIKMGKLAYNCVIGLCEAIEMNHSDWQVPLTYDSNVFNHPSLDLNVLRARKYFRDTFKETWS